jgi:hypothetical protein
MIRWSLALIVTALVGVAASAQIVPLRPRIATTNPVVLSIVIESPTASPTYATSSAGIAVNGRATGSGITSVTGTCATCTPTTLTCVGTTEWACGTVTQAVGDNTIIVTVHSASTTATDQVVSTYTAGDVTAPTVELTSPVSIAHAASGSTSVTSSTITLSGTAADNVAPTSVSWSCAGCPTTVGTATLTGTSWTAIVPLTAGSGNVITVTAHDQAGNHSANSDLQLTVTYTPGLTLTTSSLACAQVSTAYTTSLFATGGVAPYTWTVSSGTLNTGLSLSQTGSPAHGVISGTPSSSGQSRTFTIQVTDSALTPATHTFTLLTNAAAGCTGVHAYFDALKATDTYSLAHYWSLRDQGQINNLHKPTGVSLQYHYRWPGASSSLCYNGVCDDPGDAPQDAAKIEVPLIPCSPLSLTRAIASSTSGTPTQVTLTDGAGLTLGASYPVAITGHSVSSLNGTWTYTVSSTSKLIGTINGNGVGGGTGGSGVFSTCDCSSAHPVCGGSDDLGGNTQLFFTSGVSADGGDTLLATWDALFETSWRTYSNLTKTWGAFDFAGSATGKGASIIALEQHDDSINTTPGNGAGSTSVGAVSLTLAATKILGPGMLGSDGGLSDGTPQRMGEGAANGSKDLPLIANFHVNTNVWTRYWFYVQTDVPISDARFAKWRADAGVTAPFAITSCTNADPVVCTLAGEWAGIDDKGNRKANTGATLVATIAGNTDAALNGTRTVTIVTTTSVSFPKPTGAVGGTGGTFDPHFECLSAWIADENRDPVRILFQMPYERKDAYLYLLFLFDTSAKAAERQGLMYGYVRNVVMLKNYPLNMSATCHTDYLGGTTNLDRGYCTADVATNPALFVRPVR